MKFGQEMKANLILSSVYLTSYLYRDIYRDMKLLWKNSLLFPSFPAYTHTKKLLFQDFLLFTWQSCFVMYNQESCKYKIYGRYSIKDCSGWRSKMQEIMQWSCQSLNPLLERRYQLFTLLISTSIFLHLLNPWIFTATPKQWSIQVLTATLPCTSYYTTGKGAPLTMGMDILLSRQLRLTPNLLLFPLQLKHCFLFHFSKWFRTFLDLAPLYSTG